MKLTLNARNRELVPSRAINAPHGGADLTVMRAPDGVGMPQWRVYLEVIKNEGIVFTNAFAQAWEPADLCVEPLENLVAVS